MAEYEMVISYTIEPGWHDYRPTDETIRRFNGGVETRITLRCALCGDVKTTSVWRRGDKLHGLSIGGYPCSQGWQYGTA